MDEPVPIEGIIEGEPESLAAVCAAGGSAIIAYCSAVGVRAYAAESAVAALGAFRRGVVEHADRDPAELETLLLTCAADAARRVAGVAPSREQEAAGRVALETAQTAPLEPGLAPRIIRALVDAAPVTALGGDAAAVRRVTEQRYVQVFDGGRAAAAQAPASSAGHREDAEDGWLPPELAELDADAANARAVIPPQPGWSAVREAPAPAPAPAPVELPEHAPLPPPSAAPTVAPAPGALVIKRGGHWPFRRSARKPSPGWGGGFSRRPPWIAVAAGVAGIALGAGIAAVAIPAEETERPASLVRALDTPFTVDGAVFNVARTNQASWALVIRQRPLREGHTWLTLAVQTRNASRPSFLPRTLGYRLRMADGIIIGPETADIPDELTAARGRQATGQRSSVHLGFQVPRAQRGLTLEFEPSPRGPRVRVPLN